MVSDSKSLSGHKRSHSRNRCGKGKQKFNHASDGELCRHRSGSRRRECRSATKAILRAHPSTYRRVRQAGDLRHRRRPGASPESSSIHPIFTSSLKYFFRAGKCECDAFAALSCGRPLGGVIPSGFDCSALQWVVRRDHLQAGLERDVQETCSR